MRMIRIAVLSCLPAMLVGCSIVRSVDDAVSPALEQVPVFKMVGIQARTPVPAKGAQSKTDPGAVAAEIGKRQALRLVLCTARWVNPNALGEAAPVRIRIAELSAASHFATMPAAKFFAADKAVMGADIRDFQDFVIAPGSMLSVGWIGSKPGTLGIAADFRSSADNRSSRVVLPLDDATTTAGWMLYVHGTTLHLLRDQAIPAGENDAVAPAVCGKAQPPADGEVPRASPSSPL